MSELSVWDEAAFERAVAGGGAPILIEFRARWCPPCNALAPVLGGVAERLRGRLVVATIDVDDHPALAARHGVRGVPTMIVFRGREAVARKVGAAGAGAIGAWIESVI